MGWAGGGGGLPIGGGTLRFGASRALAFTNASTGGHRIVYQASALNTVNELVVQAPATGASNLNSFTTQALDPTAFNGLNGRTWYNREHFAVAVANDKTSSLQNLAFLEAWGGYATSGGTTAALADTASAAGTTLTIGTGVTLTGAIEPMNGIIGAGLLDATFIVTQLTGNTITAASWSSSGGGLATFTTTSNHGMTAGTSPAIVSGMTPAGYNVANIPILSVPAANQFVVSMPVNPGTASVMGAQLGGIGTYTMNQSSGTITGPINIVALPSPPIIDIHATGWNPFLANAGTSTSSSVTGFVATIGGSVGGYFQPGQKMVGTGITANSYIVKQQSGTPNGAGDYLLSQSSAATGTIAISATGAHTLESWANFNPYTGKVTIGAWEHHATIGTTHHGSGGVSIGTTTDPGTGSLRLTGSIVSTGGGLAIAGSVSGVTDYTQSAGNLNLNSGNILNWASKTAIKANADGTLTISKTDGTTGATLDFSTAATVKIRNLANNADGAFFAGAGTFSALLTTVASGTGSSGFNLPHGAAPSSPVNGDMWTTTSGLFVRINGSTVGPLS